MNLTTGSPILNSSSSVTIGYLSPNLTNVAIGYDSRPRPRNLGLMDDAFYKFYINKLEKKIEQLEMMVEKLLVLNKLENDIQLQNHGYGNITIDELKKHVPNENFNDSCYTCYKKFEIDDCVVKIIHPIKRSYPHTIFVHNDCYLKMISLDNEMGESFWFPQNFRFEFERYKIKNDFTN